MRFVTSSVSDGDGGAVEVARLTAGGAVVRNSGEPEVMLVFSRAAWEAFATGLRNGEFDTPGSHDSHDVHPRSHH